MLASESREPREADHLQQEHSGSQRWCVERLLEGKVGNPSCGGREQSFCRTGHRQQRSVPHSDGLGMGGKEEVVGE